MYKYITIYLKDIFGKGVNGMSNNNQNVPQLEKIKSASSRIGVTTYFIRKAISDGRLKYTKVGNCFMIDTNELKQLIESNTYRNN